VIKLTPIEAHSGIHYKRDDLAEIDLGVPVVDRVGGSKVRQYLEMVGKAPKDAVLIVGCSSNSAQQIYIADAARRTGREGIIILPGRKKKTSATLWAAGQPGVRLIDVRPGYRSVVIAKMREEAKRIGNVVRWDRLGAVKDTASQITNSRTFPDVKRIIVPVGSGLVAAGVLAGLADRGLKIPVHGFAVSQLADKDEIIKAALTTGALEMSLPLFVFDKLEADYDDPEFSRLPDGTILDPFYAGKVHKFVRPGDLFWITGCRPLAAMPKIPDGI
jgi:1-aminocyclopropane-1-carboxylate deaminase/D-cysteine desulfhydrase-like pyridoxal-dependent ACC family enzyme